VIIVRVDVSTLEHDDVYHPKDLNLSPAHVVAWIIRF